MEYEDHIRGEVQEFVNLLQSAFAGQYDYIEGIDSESSEGLDHLDDYEEGVFNENPLEVSIGFPGIDDMSMKEFKDFDDEVKSFADKEGVRVESTAGNGDFVEYTFYLHGAFLDVPK